MSDGSDVIEFIETFCIVPEGQLVGQNIKLAQFKKDFLIDVYDNPKVTRRAILSMGRKNGKSALVSCILLAHICGPMAKQNEQIASCAL